MARVVIHFLSLRIKNLLPHATFAPFQDIKKVNANKSKRNAASNLHTKNGHGKVPFNDAFIKIRRCIRLFRLRGTLK